MILEASCTSPYPSFLSWTACRTPSIQWTSTCSGFHSAQSYPWSLTSGSPCSFLSPLAFSCTLEPSYRCCHLFLVWSCWTLPLSSHSSPFLRALLSCTSTDSLAACSCSWTNPRQAASLSSSACYFAAHIKSQLPPPPSTSPAWSFPSLQVFAWSFGARWATFAESTSAGGCTCSS